MTDTSEEIKWTQVRIDYDLVEEIDEVVREARIHGARKYFSRTDFVRDAVFRLLEAYTNEHKSDKRKNVGEEILVSRKK